MQKLAIVTTHPIQYYAPVFRLLAMEKTLQVKVFYTYEKVKEVYDAGFGKSFAWDIPLLEGYVYTFVSNNGNTKKDFISVRNPSLISEIESWGATAVLFYGWNYYSHLKAIKYFKGRIKVLFRGDSTLMNQLSGFKSLLRKQFLSWVYSSVDCALYVGSANKRYYEFCNMKKKQLVFAPHAVDNNRFKHATDEHLAFVQKMHLSLGIQEDHIVVLYCAKFQTVKNPVFLVEAFKKIDNPNLRLIMVGNGELEEQLKTVAKGDERITFLPFQNQSIMPAVYRLGDLFVLPSKSETWGLAVNEAMACGKAVLVSDQCGCAEDLISIGDNGAIFESGNETDFTNKINQLIISKKRLKEMGAYSKKRIESWSFEQQVNAIKKQLG